MKNERTVTEIENDNLSYADLAVKHFSASCRTILNGLKAELVSRLTSEFPGVKSQFVRQAVAEADALASLTSVPHLLMPTLAEEKVLGLVNWANHQKAINQRSGLAFAA